MEPPPPFDAHAYWTPERKIKLLELWEDLGRAPLVAAALKIPRSAVIDQLEAMGLLLINRTALTNFSADEALHDIGCQYILDMTTGQRCGCVLVSDTDDCCIRHGGHAPTWRPNSRVKMRKGDRLWVELRRRRRDAVHVAQPLAPR